MLQEVLIIFNLYYKKRINLNQKMVLITLLNFYQNLTANGF